jgi:hypothetical protein
VPAGEATQRAVQENDKPRVSACRAAAREPLSAAVASSARGACAPVKIRQLAARIRVQLRERIEEKLKFPGKSLRNLSGSTYLRISEWSGPSLLRVHKENGAHPVKSHEKLNLAAKSHLGGRKSVQNVFHVFNQMANSKWTSRLAKRKGLSATLALLFCVRLTHLNVSAFHSAKKKMVWNWNYTTPNPKLNCSIEPWNLIPKLQCSTAEIVHSSASQRFLR